MIRAVDDDFHRLGHPLLVGAHSFIINTVDGRRVHYWWRGNKCHMYPWAIHGSGFVTTTSNLLVAVKAAASFTVFL